MRILIVSDTHGRETNFKKALKEAGKIDGLIHLGDSESTRENLQRLANCPVYMVAGNCDCLRGVPLTRIEEIDGCRILMTHGHAYQVSAVGAGELREDALQNNCDVVMFGHTHRPFIDESNAGITILNPGSLTFPRQEGRAPSYILMETKHGEKPLFTLRYLKKK